MQTQRSVLICCHLILYGLTCGCFADVSWRYVSPGGAHQPPFTNWMSAATNIQAAVDVAGSGDTVLVADGYYPLTTEIVVSTNILLASTNGADATVVDGNGASRCFRLLSGAGCTVNGFTIMNGAHFGASWESSDYGGGVWMGPSNQLLNCTVAGCTSSVAGGIYATMGTISNCTIWGNNASRDAGGAYCEGGVVRDCRFTSNTTWIIAGGLWHTWEGVSPIVQDCTFAMNSSRGIAGGLCIGTKASMEALSNVQYFAYYVGHSTRPQLDLLEARVTNVLSQLPEQSGSLTPPLPGAAPPCLPLQPLVPSLAPPRSGILDCVLISNTAPIGAGLSVAGTPDLVASNCVVQDNRAIIGAGVFLRNGGCLCNSTVVGNHADHSLMIPSDGTWPLAGGAMIFDSGELRDCRVVSNAAEIAGAVFLTTLDINVLLGGVPGTNSAVQPLIRNCAIEGNEASFLGGGVIMLSMGVVTGNTIAGNSATWGGGAVNWGGRLSDSLLASNNASFGGGCMSVVGEVSNCILQANTAAWLGGGLLAESAAVVRRCSITGNRALAGGGAGLFSNAMVEACTATDNDAVLAGGGAFCFAGGELRSSILARNTAWNGGGLYTLDGGQVLNCTVAGNAATNAAGGLYALTNAPGGPEWQADAVIVNSILSGNSATLDAEHREVGANAWYSRCCTLPVPGTGDGTSFTNAPLFVNTNGWADLRLAAGSPCVNAGSNLGWMVGASDLDGHPRVIGGLVDIGAHESTNGVTGHGLPWGWLLANSLATDGSADLLDADGDGLDNAGEYVAGTDPTNCSSRLALTGNACDGAVHVIQWDSVSGRLYRVYGSTNLLGAWRTNSPGLPGTGGAMRYTNSTPAAIDFLRVGVQAGE